MALTQRPRNTTPAVTTPGGPTPAADRPTAPAFALLARAGLAPHSTYAYGLLPGLLMLSAGGAAATALLGVGARPSTRTE
ncbi:hypothetical protein [Streptomyces sp. NPDC050560]|uniref:hypothetical protein n=1 Tax=Streptomyces sp. NPDC050560 TaxID=3365630 RepID=UPI0037876F6F